MNNVCLITTVHAALDTRIFFREAKSLQEAGYRVTLIVQYPEKSDIVDGIVINGLPEIKNRFQRFFLGWLAYWKAVDLGSDIYHIHDPELIPVGVFLRLLTRKPVIYDVHEHYPDAIQDRTWIPSWLRNTLSTIFDFLEKYFAGFFSAIISADEVISERFIGRGILVETIYNFPERKYFANPNDQLSLPEKHPIQLIYVGAITPQRGLWVMLDMMEIILDDFQIDVGLWLVGKIGTELEMRDIEDRLSDHLKLKSRVDFVGWIPFGNVPTFLRKADIGLVPLQPISKFYKNIPTKQFEYMAAGLPIIGSDLPPIRKFLEASQAGIVATPSNPRSFADKVKCLSENPDYATSLGRRGIQAFREIYNWETEETKLLSLYQELLN